MSASPAKTGVEEEDEEDASSSSIELPLNQLLLFRTFFLLVTTTIGASKILSSSTSFVTFILSSSPSSSLSVSLFPLCNIKLSSNARLASGFKIAISSSSIALRINTFSITYVSIGGNCLASSRPIEDKILLPLASIIGRTRAVFTSIFAIVHTNLRFSALKSDDPLKLLSE